MLYYPKKNEAFYSILLFYRIHLYYPNIDSDKNILRFSQWFLIRNLTIFNFVGICIHFIMSIKNGSYAVIIEDLALGLGYFSIFIGLLLFRKNHKLWAQFLRDLTNFEKFKKPKNYDLMVKRFNMLSLVGALYALMGTYLYVRLPIVNHKPCETINELHGLNEICGLAYPFWWPRELTSLQKCIVCIFQTVSLALSSVPAIQVILLPVTIVEILKTRVEHFSTMLCTVFDKNSDEDEVKKRMKYCIEYHQYIIDYILSYWKENIRISEAFIIFSLGTTFNKLYFSNFAHLTSAASIVIALILTQLLQVFNWGNVAHVGAWIGGLFLVSRAGQMLEDMFLDISEITYFTNWYDANLTNRKEIIFLMMRSQKPIYLEAIPCGKHNFPMFVALGKTTYSYLTLMTKYK